MGWSVLVYGAGKMGQAVVSELSHKKSWRLHALVGREARKGVAGAPDVQRMDANLLEGVDAIIDFSLPGALDPLIEALSQRPKPWPVLVSGVTGLEGSFPWKFKILSKDTAVFHSPNFSLGIAILSSLSQDAFVSISALDYPVDIHVLDFHHREKRDNPSGTARRLGEPLFVADDHYHGIRAGGLFGEHQILMTMKDEQITLTHRAFSRNIFARGALEVIDWLCTVPITSGYWSMDSFIDYSLSRAVNIAKKTEIRKVDGDNLTDDIKFIESAAAKTIGMKRTEDPKKIKILEKVDLLIESTRYIVPRLYSLNKNISEMERNIEHQNKVKYIKKIDYTKEMHDLGKGMRDPVKKIKDLMKELEDMGDDRSEG